MTLPAAGEFVRVGGATDIEPGAAKAYRVGRYDVAVFNVGGDYYALENSCPHQGAPIADGWLDGAVITCPWHAWSFDVRTGGMMLGDFSFVRRFRVELRNGSIWVRSEPEREA